MFETINSHVQQSQQALRGALSDQIGRLSAMYEEIGRLEEAGLSLATATIDGSSEWLKKSVATSEKLIASARQAATGTATQVGQPMAPFAETFGAFRRLAEEQATRMATYGDQVARLEHEGTGRLTDAFDECARLLKESLRYGAQMTSAWRSLAVEAAKRTADSVNPKA